ncbi:FtsZ/tubulin family protein [Alkalimarinus alittae]|uniref:Tubulin/FtsZ GTPase domain-containing protein n=1 Tax=Alkalimarinus alittae TaxID=2961619 RepID=A0ABY6MX74_9ALTE|nr:hypothetical protein [Alkalimarinus alittae]UZE94423.1 hypothetical protein NKI27_09975 [Alkalimarinus alittae]
MFYECTDNHTSILPDIRIVGVGGAGINILNQICTNTENLSFIAMDSSKGCIDATEWEQKVILGGSHQKLGGGGNPEKGRQFAMQSLHDIEHNLSGADMVLLVAGLGGGVGSGALPVIADVAKKVCSVVICFTVMPFPFEGKKRSNFARETCQALEHLGVAIAVLSNKQVLNNFPPETPFLEIMKEMGYQLSSLVSKFLNIIMTNGMINIDFSDMKTILSARGHLFIGNPENEKTTLSEDLIEQAMDNKVLDPFHLSQANRAILLIEAGAEFNLGCLHDIGGKVEAISQKDMNLIMGVNITSNIRDGVKVMLLMMSEFETAHQTSEITLVSQWHE